MAPLKAVNNNVMVGITTRKKATVGQTTHLKDIKELVRSKRKADCSPSKENKIKRIAFGEKNVNLQNNKAKALEEKDKKTVTLKKVTVQLSSLQSVRTVQKPRQNENLAPPPAPANKVVTRASNKAITIPNQTTLKAKDVTKDASVDKVKTRLSNEFEKTEDSLYSSALEDINDTSAYFSAKKQQNRRSTRSSSIPSPYPTKEEPENNSANVSLVTKQIATKLHLGNYEVPSGIDDFDKENWDDVFQVSHYAMDIFNYLKERETRFQIGDYLDKQFGLTRWMRALLVDWMVEIQESFELNHETLYLAVKLVDMYLSKVAVSKDTLQLVGAASMFIASKYDERIPPMIDDFLYICDGAYRKRELIRMEINVLKVCDFDLGIPISYRFLRRYARCGKIPMNILTLARFILEFSLMDYATVHIRDSKLAAAALYLALRMKNVSRWTPTLEYYTGYKLEEFKPVVLLLNNGLHKPIKSQLMTVRNKYSHEIFFEVAKTPLLQNEAL